jgi:hypothetical protein
MKVRSGAKASGLTLGTAIVRVLEVPAAAAVRRALRYPLWDAKTARCAANWCVEGGLGGDVGPTAALLPPTLMMTSGGVARVAAATASRISHARYREYILILVGLHTRSHLSPVHSVMLKRLVEVTS